MLIYIQAIQNESDRSLVEELYSKYSSTMLYIAQSILKDRYRAEDAVTQAFVKIIDNLQKFYFEDCNKTKGLVVYIADTKIKCKRRVYYAKENSFFGSCVSSYVDC